MVTKNIQNRQGKKYCYIIDVSNGTDWSFTQIFEKKLGLPPHAAHFDNSWNSKTSISNIKNAISKLEIDLQTYVVDRVGLKNIQKTCHIAGFPSPGLPSDIAIRVTLYHNAVEESIKYILRGNTFSTEWKMPAELTTVDGDKLKYFQRRFNAKKIRSFPNLTFLNLLYFQLIKLIKIFQILNYIKHSKTEGGIFSKMKAPNKSVYDIPTYMNLIQRYSIWASPILKVILCWTPPFVHEVEMRKRDNISNGRFG